MTLLVGRNLVKSYRRRRVVDDVSVRVEPGEIVGLLGPNGAGKTTTFLMVLGMVRPDAGSISILGHDPGEHDNEMLQRIGIVLQEGGLEDELTVAEAIAAQARPYRHPMPVDEAIAYVGLEAKRDERISRLRSQLAQLEKLRSDIPALRPATRSEAITR